uniref:Uncharacterized protein n=1 Tax=Knipowitschia caucasica TaxID=637954 RepID=A0AAV2LDZ6_KNICA
MEATNHLGDLSQGDGCTRPNILSLCLCNRGRDGGIEENLKVFLPPPDNIPRRGQQLSTRTVHGVGKELLPPPEAPDGLPESLRGRPIVMLHGLSELLPVPGFCLCNSPGRGTLGLPVLDSCLRSPPNIMAR